MRPIDSNSGKDSLAPAVLTDFDDTAAEQNVAELLLQQFGDPTWTDIRARFREGEFTLIEYQEIVFRNILADRATMQAYVKENANLRPYFRELWDYCQDNRIPLAVVSQGLDFYIEALLEKEGYPLRHSSPAMRPVGGGNLLGSGPRIPVYSVNTDFTQDGITYEYRYMRPGHERQGNSKGLIVEQYRDQGYYIVYIGDGHSDFEAGEMADLLFAHRTLAEECNRKQIPFRPFSDFGDVLRGLGEFSAGGLSSQAPA